MMILNLYPSRMDNPIVVEKIGDTLIINGVSFDFSAIPEGYSLHCSAIEGDYSELFRDTIDRVNGKLNIHLMLPIGVNAPYESRYPEPIEIEIDGIIQLPPYEADTNV